MADEKTDPQIADNPERPDWLPEKFKSAEDLAKSYGELESKLGELSERAKYAETLEENYQALAAQVDQLQTAQTAQAQQQAQSPLIAAYQDAYERGDAAQMLAVNAEISKLALRQELQSVLPQIEQRVGTLAESQAQEIGNWAAGTLAARYGDAWEQNRETLSHVIETQPWLIPEEAKTNPQVALAALDNVFKIATHGNVQPTAQAQAADAEAERARLLAAQTATGAGTRTLTGDEAKAEWDKIRSAGDKPYWASLPQ